MPLNSLAFTLPLLFVCFAFFSYFSSIFLPTKQSAKRNPVCLLRIFMNKKIKCHHPVVNCGIFSPNRVLTIIIYILFI